MHDTTSLLNLIARPFHAQSFHFEFSKNEEMQGGQLQRITKIIWQELNNLRHTWLEY